MASDDSSVAEATADGSESDEDLAAGHVTINRSPFLPAEVWRLVARSSMLWHCLELAEHATSPAPKVMDLIEEHGC